MGTVAEILGAHVARIAAAQKVLERPFGVATECGIGRAPEGTTEGILRTHAEVADPR